MATNAELAQLSTAAYNQTGAPAGWTRLDIPSPANDVGYYGAAFRDDIIGGNRHCQSQHRTTLFIRLVVGLEQ